MKPIISVDVTINRRLDLKNDYFSLQLGSFPHWKKVKPGQFVHIGFPNSPTFYRRAFSIAGVVPQSGDIEVIIKAVGRGSRYLASLRKGDTVNLLGPLGKPFNLPGKSRTMLLVGGGVGYPPMLFVATRLIERGWDPQRIVFFYGGASSKDIVDRTRIRQLGARFVPVTDDGSFGAKGLVTEPLIRALESGEFTNPTIFACGPEGMLKAVDSIALAHSVPGELALEAPMPCGVGICLGCVRQLNSGGYARVCVEGPVFAVGEAKL